MYFDGVERMGWVLGDFCFEERYRSLGPALQLQRVCLEAAGEAPFEFCYDFPSLSMMAVYKRLGISQTGTLVRWVKPLRLEPKLEPIVHSKKLARMLGAIGNVAMRWRGSQRDDSACDLALHPGACSAEFTALDQQLRECPGIFTARTAEYLNWRYLAHPGESYEILAARREGELVGYAVFSQDGEEARIVDLCSPHEPDVIAHLLAGVLQLLTARGVATVDMVAGSSHPWSALFRRAGFWRREESPVVAYTPNGALPFDSASLANWHLMQGERDS